MKKILRTMSLVMLMAIVGIGLVACGGGGEPETIPDNIKPSGFYVNSNVYTIYYFDGNGNMQIADMSINGAVVTITVKDNGTYTTGIREGSSYCTVTSSEGKGAFAVHPVDGSWADSFTRGSGTTVYSKITSLRDFADSFKDWPSDIIDYANSNIPDGAWAVNWFAA